MQLLSWTPILYSRSGFPRDENGRPYFEGNIIEEALTSAIIYYFVKKDKEIENKVKRFLLREELSLDSVVSLIKNTIFKKYGFNKFPDIPKKIHLTGVYTTYIDVMDLKTWDVVDSFRAEAFEGEIHISLESPYIEKIKAAGHSYVEALLKMEMDMLKDHPLVEAFYIPMINRVKNWDIPLRLGWWTDNIYNGNLLFFWRIKEIRERFLRDFKLDIKPQRVILLPQEGATAGWAELKKEV